MLPVAAMVSCPRMARSIVCRIARSCDMVWISRPSVSWSAREGVGGVGVDLLAQLVLVRTLLIQPEHHRHARVPRPGDRQLDPVADRRVGHEWHPPNVAG